MSDVSEIAHAELIRRVIETARRGKVRGWCPLWAKVSDRFLLGSTFARQLRRRFGFDPDEQVRP